MGSSAVLALPDFLLEVGALGVDVALGLIKLLLTGKQGIEVGALRSLPSIILRGDDLVAVVVDVAHRSLRGAFPPIAHEALT